MNYQMILKMIKNSLLSIFDMLKIIVFLKLMKMLKNSLLKDI